MRANERAAAREVAQHAGRVLADLSVMSARGAWVAAAAQHLVSKSVRTLALRVVQAWSRYTTDRVVAQRLLAVSIWKGRHVRGLRVLHLWRAVVVQDRAAANEQHQRAEADGHRTAMGGVFVQHLVGKNTRLALTRVVTAWAAVTQLRIARKERDATVSEHTAQLLEHREHLVAHTSATREAFLEVGAGRMLARISRGKLSTVVDGWHAYAAHKTRGRRLRTRGSQKNGGRRLLAALREWNAAAYEQRQSGKSTRTLQLLVIDRAFLTDCVWLQSGLCQYGAQSWGDSSRGGRTSGW
jgi:hypothetical protein